MRIEQSPRVFTITVNDEELIRLGAGLEYLAEETEAAGEFEETAEINDMIDYMLEEIDL